MIRRLLAWVLLCCAGLTCQSEPQSPRIHSALTISNERLFDSPGPTERPAGWQQYDSRAAVREGDGLLTWSDTRRDATHFAHSFRDDVKQSVTANADGRRLAVKNGDKLLAAVAPREPTWVRVVDEEVARSLGWYR